MLDKWEEASSDLRGPWEEMESSRTEGWQAQPECYIAYIPLNISFQALCLSCALSQCSNGDGRFRDTHSGPRLFFVLEASLLPGPHTHT